MAEIGFYHLTRSGLEDALPRLLGRTLEAGQRAVIRCGNAERLAALDTALWLCQEPDWLPVRVSHGLRERRKPFLRVRSELLWALWRAVSLMCSLVWLPLNCRRRWAFRCWWKPVPGPRA